MNTSTHSNNGSLTGNYVVAGGTKGIGLALVNRLRATAARVDVYSRGIDELTVDDVVRHYTCDFSDPAAIMTDLPDQIHGVAYCPGSINLRSFKSLKLSDFATDMQVNFYGAIQFLQQCYPALNRDTDGPPKSAVLFSTVAVGQGLPMHASIAAAKAAVEGLMRSLAAEWSPRIRVNCLAPALTETPLAAKFFSTPAAREALSARYPLGRTGQAEDLAALAAFLLSTDAGWITGQTIGVDGGMSTLRK
jgi:3-oxoacyl-[acyl-carrier protein] reductase